jgi:exopolysaccharide biosynthesis polyprenyl glycosylphosphotransferase
MWLHHEPAKEIAVNVFGDASARASTDFGYGRAAGTLRRRVRTWSRVLVVVLITALTSVVLLTGAGNISTFGLLEIVAASTAIWLLALWGVAARARARGLDALTAAAIGTVTGMALLAALDIFFVEGTIAPVELVVIAGGFFLLASALEGVTSIPLRRRPRIIFLLGRSAPIDFEHIQNGGSNGNGHYHYVGVLSDRPEVPEKAGMTRLGGSGDLLEVVDTERPDVLVVPNELRRTMTCGQLLDSGEISVQVTKWVDFYERVFHRVPGVMTESWFTSILDIQRASYPRRRKRAFDIVVACTALLVFLPLILLIWLALRISGGDVFYRQTRSGEGGKLFQVVKFRTMVPDAETGVAVYASASDPRVTRVGRILRRTRWDELPQFWNVLRGEMSVVGPRPERPEHVGLLEREVPYWNRRLLLKPGITGWAQIQLGYTDNVSGAASKLSYDLYYLKHRSLSFDVLILIATLRLLFTGRGAR